MCEINRFKEKKEIEVFKVVYEKNENLYSLFYNFELTIGKVEEKNYKYVKKYLAKNWNLDMRGKVSGFEKLESAEKLLKFAKKNIKYPNLQIIKLKLGGLLYRGSTLGMLDFLYNGTEKIYAGTEILEIFKN